MVHQKRAQEEENYLICLITLMAVRELALALTETSK